MDNCICLDMGRGVNVFSGGGIKADLLQLSHKIQQWVINKDARQRIFKQLFNNIQAIQLLPGLCLRLAFDKSSIFFNSEMKTCK